jgi:hypothetical protein
MCLSWGWRVHWCGSCLLQHAHPFLRTSLFPAQGTSGSSCVHCPRPGIHHFSQDLLPFIRQWHLQPRCGHRVLSLPPATCSTPLSRQMDTDYVRTHAHLISLSTSVPGLTIRTTSNWRFCWKSTPQAHSYLSPFLTGNFFLWQWGTKLS